MWKQIVGTPSMDGFVKKPDLLSFYIASKIPISDPTRQELLEIDGVSYRLRREIELLERLDRVRCKICKVLLSIVYEYPHHMVACFPPVLKAWHVFLWSMSLPVFLSLQTVIARRSDMLVMSTDGPMGAYVNSYGYVHEVMTFRKAKGLATRGRPHKEYSWFPGYVLQLSFSRTSMKPITFKLNTMDS